MLKNLKTWVRKHDTIAFAARLMYRASDGSPLVYHCRDYTMNGFVRTLMKYLVFPFRICRYFLGRKDIPGREGLAFVLIAKNEASYIKEWLDFHIKQGVSKFIIYDNESTDNFREVLQPYIESGIVIYDIIRGKRRQTDAYNMALNKYRYMFKYMGFIDADEFVFVRNNTYGGGGHCDLVTFMNDFMAAHPNAGGLGINWLVFGSSHHEKRPAGGVIENFTMCAERDFMPNRHIKTICDPVKAISAGAHYTMYSRGFHNLDENGEIIGGALSGQPHFEKIRINHYFCKSKDEYIAIKMKRGDVALGISSKNTTLNVFNSHDRNEVIDTEILSHV